MVNYRRDYTPGAAFRFAQKKAYFHAIAIVVMPEHLHAIWRLPNGDYDYSRRWRIIKGHFTRSLLTAGLAFVNDKSGEYTLR